MQNFCSLNTGNNYKAAKIITVFVENGLEPWMLLTLNKKLGERLIKSSD